MKGPPSAGLFICQNQELCPSGLFRHTMRSSQDKWHFSKGQLTGTFRSKSCECRALGLKTKPARSVNGSPRHCRVTGGCPPRGGVVWDVSGSIKGKLCTKIHSHETERGPLDAGLHSWRTSAGRLQCLIVVRLLSCAGAVLQDPQRRPGAGVQMPAAARAQAPHLQSRRH